MKHEGKTRMPAKTQANQTVRAAKPHPRIPAKQAKEIRPYRLWHCTAHETDYCTGDPFTLIDSADGSQKSATPTPKKPRRGNPNTASYANDQPIEPGPATRTTR
ncbi:hypothetical protein SB861_08470 [Paraburkholderia sp. SIMBA_049]